MKATLNEYAGFDGLGLVELIANNGVSAQEALEATIEQAERVSPRRNAICLRDDDLARHTLAARTPQGSFGGVPLLFKDVHTATFDLPTSRGSHFFRAARATSRAWAR